MTNPKSPSLANGFSPAMAKGQAWLSTQHLWGDRTFIAKQLAKPRAENSSTWFQVWSQDPRPTEQNPPGNEQAPQGLATKTLWELSVVLRASRLSGKLYSLQKEVVSRPTTWPCILTRANNKRAMIRSSTSLTPWFFCKLCRTERVNILLPTKY